MLKFGHTVVRKIKRRGITSTGRRVITSTGIGGASMRAMFAKEKAAKAAKTAAELQKQREAIAETRKIQRWEGY